MAAPDITTPSRQLIRHLTDELRRHVPFSEMAREQVEAFARAARESYYAPGEVVLEPGAGVVDRLLFIRRGAVRGQRGIADVAAGGVHYEAGDLFPVSAVVGQRAVTATYEALEDLFCLEVDAAMVRELAAGSGPWADFLNRRVLHFLDLSRQALRESQAAQALTERAMETPLSELPRKPLVTCRSDEPLIEVLQRMQRTRVGSMMAVDEAGAVLGILTRHDLLERVALARPPDDTPALQVMTRPVSTVGLQATMQDAALLMSRHGIRHLPIVDEGRVVNVISERDLFAMQRLSLRNLSGAIRAAPDREALVRNGAEIRQFARHLVGQGVSAGSLTQLLSHLNDLLAARLVELTAQAHGLDLSRACWLAFGSEGRAEQTIATDQDNGLVFLSDDPGADRPRWLALGQAVNEALDECGYPLCKGGIMAGQPACCRTPEEWIERFDQWIERGTPEDLLACSIYFDLRPLAGNAALAAPLRAFITRRAAEVPRFIKMLVENALRFRPPLSWRGGLDPTVEGRHEWIDLKLQGTAIFVEAARIYALAQGIEDTGTRARLEAVARATNTPATEAANWVGGFEYLQMSRMRLQMDTLPDPGNPNRVDLATLGAIDRRVLKETFRVGRELQRKLELDYMR